MSGNVTHDPVVHVTEAELAAVMESRARRRLSGSFKKTDSVIRNMGIQSRLWWVAEFVWQSRDAKVGGRDKEASEWNQRAKTAAHLALSEELNRFSTAAPDDVSEAAGHLEFLCQCVRDALKGDHPSPSDLTAKERVRFAVIQFHSRHQRFPTQKELMDENPGFRWEDIKSTYEDLGAQWGVQFPQGKRGPKPKGV